MRTVAEFEATVFVSAGLAGMTGAEDFEAGSGSLVWLWANVGGGGALVAESPDRPKPALALGGGATAPPEPKLGVAVLDDVRPKLGTEAAAVGGGGLIGVEVEAIWSKVEAKLSLVPPPNGAEAAGG